MSPTLASPHAGPTGAGPTRPVGARRPHRRTVQARRNAVVLAWILAAAVLGVLVAAGPLAGVGGWLPLHTLLLGGIGSAITVWSAHFADTLLHRPALGGNHLLDARLTLHGVGAAGVLTGIATMRPALTAAGAAAVAGAALAGALAIAVQRRRAVAPRFGALAVHYAVALTLLATGALLGWLLSRANDRGRALLADQLYLAHVPTMVMGFVGTTVIGTLVVLWPTMLRTAMEPEAPRLAARSLPLLVAGTTVTALAGLWRPAAAIGALLYLVGASGVAGPALRTARRVPPTSFATASAGAAVVWLGACVVRIGTGVALAPSLSAARAVVHEVRYPLALGFVLQVLLAALSYLTPVMLGGGPATTRATNALMDRAAAYRMVATNACLVLALTPVPSLPHQVRLVAGVAAALVAGWVLVALVGSVRVLRARLRGQDDDVVATTIPGGRPGTGTGGAAAPGPVPSDTDRRGALAGLLTAGVAAVAGALAAGGTGATDATTTSGGVVTGAGSQAASSTITPTGHTVTQTVTVDGMRFVPDTVDVALGDRLVLTLDNTGDMVHDLVLATGQDTGRLGAGQSATIEVSTVTGPIEGWCSVTGHRAMGMVLAVTVDGTSGTGAAGQAAPSAGTDSAAPDLTFTPPKDFEAFDAVLPPAPSNADGPVTHRHTFAVEEVVAPVGGGVTQTRMTYNGQVPGPVLRGHVGDTFEVTLVNNGTMSHSIDFHAGVVSPDEPMRSIGPGESLVYTFTAQRSGTWLYHCSTAPMSVHLASGMHGAVVIDPDGLAPVDREYLLVQSETYLGPEGGETDAVKVAAKTPDLMSFNGYAFQYAHRPLPAVAGERVRFWVLAAGPSLGCSFHVVGGQFDVVFHEGAYLLGGPGAVGSAWHGGSQALALSAAQGGFVEMVPPAAGHYTFVTHAFADMEKGAKGVLAVTD